MFKFIVLSTIIHLGLLFAPLGDTLTQEQGELTPQDGVKNPSDLIVSFISPSTPTDSSLPKGQVRGFPSNGVAPSDTFVPDDTCAWSIEDQKRRLEEAFNE